MPNKVPKVLRRYLSLFWSYRENTVGGIFTLPVGRGLILWPSRESGPASASTSDSPKSALDESTTNKK